MEKRLDASLVFVGIGIAVSGAEKHKSNSTIIQSLVHDASEIQKHVGDDIGNTTDVTDVAAKELLNSDKKKKAARSDHLYRRHHVDEEEDFEASVSKSITVMRSCRSLTASCNSFTWFSSCRVRSLSVLTSSAVGGGGGGGGAPAC